MPTIKEYLELPDNFLGDVEENWSLGPCIASRDMDNMAKVNGESLVEMMKGLRYKIIGCSHWGCGWVDHLSFPVVDGDVPTKELEVVEEWVRLLQEYPVIDEAAYYALEDERIREEVECDHADEVIEWMYTHCPQHLEEYVNPKGIEMAREALGLPPQRWWDDLVFEVGEEKAKADHCLSTKISFGRIASRRME